MGFQISRENVCNIRDSVSLSVL